MLRAAADSTVRRRVEPRSVARHVFGDHEIRMPCVSPRSEGARSGPLKAHEAEFLAGGGHGGADCFHGGFTVSVPVDTTIHNTRPYVIANVVAKC